MPLTPEQRSMRSRIGAYAMHARHDSREVTAKARDGFMARFEREVDPDGTLPEAERKRRAEAARRAYMTSLALKSSKVRARRKTAPAHSSGGDTGRPTTQPVSGGRQLNSEVGDGTGLLVGNGRGGLGTPAVSTTEKDPGVAHTTPGTTHD